MARLSVLKASALIATLSSVMAFVPSSLHSLAAHRAGSGVLEATKSVAPPPTGGGTVAAGGVRSSARFSTRPSGAEGKEGKKGTMGGDTVYTIKGWDRPMYRAPDEILFEWQELMCCLRFMEEKEVNAALLAPETREMMIGYAEMIMARGAPVKTHDELKKAMIGRWKLAFTTEDRYKALPPATRIFYDIHEDGKLRYTLKFKDKIWNALVSTASFELSNQGRLFFEFNSNYIKVNNPFDTTKSFKIPLPPNVGNLGATFSDVSYVDGTMWIEKLRDPATGAVYHTVYEYQGPCPMADDEEEQGKGVESSGGQQQQPPQPPQDDSTVRMTGGQSR